MPIGWFASAAFSQTKEPNPMIDKIELVATAIEQADEYDFRRVNSSYTIFNIDTGEEVDVVFSSGAAECVCYTLNRESKAKAAIQAARIHENE
jgi:hypothetical protein